MVNINDMMGDPINEGCKLDKIFEKQRELMNKYHEIEKKNGLLQCEEVPVNLHDKMGQARLKDLAWRFTEELGEALDAYHLHPYNLGHYREELADALHFLTEFTILAGVSAKDLLPLSFFEEHVSDKLEILFNYIGEESSFYQDVGRIIKHLGMTCNCLKNKPWKTTHMMTDVVEFKENLKHVWRVFILTCKNLGIDAGLLYDLYFLKSQVNKFRQRSGY